jgi:hypothetical protein
MMTACPNVCVKKGKTVTSQTLDKILGQFHLSLYICGHNSIRFFPGP